MNFTNTILIAKPSLIRSEDSGFTLLEVIIALAILVVALGSILTVSSRSIDNSARAKQSDIVAMLAKNLMIDTEFKIEGRTFDEIKKEEAGTFPDPYADYRWTSLIKEIKFPNLNMTAGAQAAGGATDDTTSMVTRLISKYLSDSIREVQITIFWKRGKGEQKFSVSTYWVDLNHEFSTTE